MSRRKRYEPTTKKSNAIMVNVTSLTDMFTVILVFLLQTYNTSEVQIETPKDIRVPTSLSEGMLTQGLQVMASKDSITIGADVISQITGNEFSGKDKDPKDPNFIPTLFSALDKIMKTSTDASVKDGKLSLVADKDIPYSVLKKMMYTASMAGFPQVKLITSSQ